MDRIFSVEGMSELFWAPSPATSAVASGGGGERSVMNRCSSEWLLEKFLQEEVPVPESPNLNPNPNTSNPCASSASNFSSARRDGGAGGDDEVVEIEKPHIPAVGTVPPPSDIDPGEYAAMLKQKFDMYCQAVVKARVFFTFLFYLVGFFPPLID